MVNAMQVTYQYTRGIQVEGAPQCPWRATRAQCALLGHLCPGGDLADCTPVSDSLPPPWIAKSSTRFCHGLPPSAGRDAALHAVATGIPTPRNDTKNTCPETHMQRVWVETGWPCLEQVYGQGYERYRFYA